MEEASEAVPVLGRSLGKGSLLWSCDRLHCKKTFHEAMHS